VETYTGKTLKLNCGSVCVHGDNASAVSFVKTIRAELEKQGVTVADMRRVIAG